jgi:hypothetical protein
MSKEGGREGGSKGGRKGLREGGVGCVNASLITVRKEKKPQCQKNKSLTVRNKKASVYIHMKLYICIYMNIYLYI